MPLAAVTSAGTLTVNSGSTRAIRGIKRSSRRLFLKGGSYDEITAFFVASAPVPAVVGMANTGKGGFTICKSRPTFSK